MPATPRPKIAKCRAWLLLLAIAPSSQAAIVSVLGDAVIVQDPTGFNLRFRAADPRLRVFNETVGISASVPSFVSQSYSSEISSSGPLDSHFITYSPPPNVGANVSATFEFSGDIIAVDRAFPITHPLFGRSDITYGQGSTTTISSFGFSGNTLSIQAQGNSIDQWRVLTRSTDPPPDASGRYAEVANAVGTAVGSAVAGFTDLNTGHLRATCCGTGSVLETGLMEFDIASIPTGASIDSAWLFMEPGGGANTPNAVSVYGYQGSGVPTLSDVRTTGYIGDIDVPSPGEPRRSIIDGLAVLNVADFLQDIVDDGNGWAGFRFEMDDPTEPEVQSQTFRDEPWLRVTYSIADAGGPVTTAPAPPTWSLLALGLLPLCPRSPRSGVSQRSDLTHRAG